MKIMPISALTLLLAASISCSNEYEEKLIVPAAYQSLTEHCIGRNRINLPVVFSSSYISTGIFKHAGRDDQEPSFEVLVEDAKLNAQQFKSKILKRRSELMLSESDTVDVLRKEITIDDFATLFRVQQIEKAYKSELHFLRGDSMVILTINSYHDTFISAEDRLIKFMSDFVIEDKSRTDMHERFCLGSLGIQGNFSEEKGSFLFRDMAGNVFDVDIDSFRPDDPNPLLKRMSGPNSLINLFGVSHTVLRSGERMVAGMHAQEWLGWTKLDQDDGEKRFGFAMETMRSSGGKKAPSLHISFDSAKPLADGTKTKTNLSDIEAMSLWNLVVSSIE